MIMTFLPYTNVYACVHVNLYLQSSCFLQIIEICFQITVVFNASLQLLDVPPLLLPFVETFFFISFMKYINFPDWFASLSPPTFSPSMTAASLGYKTDVL